MGAAKIRPASDPPFPATRGGLPHELGTGRLEPGRSNGRPQKILRIDATRISATLLGRLLVGSYITGQDRVLVVARGGLTPAQRSRTHRTAQRLLGTSVVEDRTEGVEVQNFIDPGKHELPRLLHRVVELLDGELRACRSVLVHGDASELETAEELEEEVDQLYLLMARQLFLSSDDPRIARDIDVPSHQLQIGDRLVAKVLEVTGDLVHAAAVELRAHGRALQRLPAGVTAELDLRVERLRVRLAETMAAFDSLSVASANATLNRIVDALHKDASLGPRLARRASDPEVAASTQRVLCNLAMGLEMLVIVNEVTINRGVEPELVALTGASGLLPITGSGSKALPKEGSVSFVASLLGEEVPGGRSRPGSVARPLH